MKREIFKRPTRMVHKFDNLEGIHDPFGSGSFDPKFPVRPDQRRSPPLEVQNYGECGPRARSPVCKPSGGYASINGPIPDYAEQFGRPIPVSTKKRKSP